MVDNDRPAAAKSRVTDGHTPQNLKPQRAVPQVRPCFIYQRQGRRYTPTGGPKRARRSAGGQTRYGSWFTWDRLPACRLHTSPKNTTFRKRAKHAIDQSPLPQTVAASMRTMFFCIVGNSLGERVRVRGPEATLNRLASLGMSSVSERPTKQERLRL